MYMYAENSYSVQVVLNKMFIEGLFFQIWGYEKAEGHRFFSVKNMWGLNLK